MLILLRLLSSLVFLFVLTSPCWAETFYVRPVGGSYGSEDGSSYDNAWDGLLNVQWASPKESGKVGPGDTLYICGLHIYTWTGSPPIATAGNINLVGGTSDEARITIRGDYPSDPGIVWGAFYDNSDTWADEGGGVWSFVLNASHYEDWYFEDVSSSSWTVLDKETSLASCQSNPGSFYAASFGSGSTLYVHTSNGLSPANRVLFNSFGYRFACAGLSYITFYNISFYNHSFIGSPKFNGASHIKFDSCVFMYASGNMIGVFDNMDYIEVVNCEIAWAGNGIYNISSTNNAPSYYTYKENYIHDIGTRITSSDAHAIGIQGGHDGEIIGNYCVRCGSGPLLYCYIDQVIYNVTIAYNWIEQGHTEGGGTNIGIGINEDNDSWAEADNIKIYGNVLKDTTEGIHPKTRCNLNGLPGVHIFNNTFINYEYGSYSSQSQYLLAIENGNTETESLDSDDVFVGATSGAAARVGHARISGSAPNVTANFTYSLLYIINFNSGGTDTISVGDILTGATSGEKCTVRRLDLSSGSWAGGDAAGKLYVTISSDDFTDNENFNLDGGQDNILTMVGNTSRPSFQVGEDVDLTGSKCAEVTYAGMKGPSLKLYNNIFYSSESPTSHVVYNTSATDYATIDSNYNIFYPSGNYYYWSGGNNDLTAWQARTTPSGSTFDPNSSETDPKINADGTLQSGSPAINFGADMGTYNLLSPNSIWNASAGGMSLSLLDADTYGWPAGAFLWLNGGSIEQLSKGMSSVGNMY